MMQRFLNAREAAEPVHMYLFAGVGTAPHFMQRFYEELAGLLERETGTVVSGGLLFPYGDWNRSLRSQVLEVWHDIRLPLDRLSRSIGGQSALLQIGPATSGRLLLIGHSGGGTAAVHAAAMLHGERQPGTVAVLQIGSPKSPVPEELQAGTAYLYAARPDGRGKDPVCRIGSWRSREGLRRLRPGRRGRAYAPDQLVPLQLAGGHPDYFRSTMLNTDGQSNLDRIKLKAWDLIREMWEEQEQEE